MCGRSSGQVVGGEVLAGAPQIFFCGGGMVLGSVTALGYGLGPVSGSVSKSSSSTLGQESPKGPSHPGERSQGRKRSAHKL